MSFEDRPHHRKTRGAQQEDEDWTVTATLSGSRATPTLIASLIEGAVARLEVDRNESHSYLVASAGAALTNSPDTAATAVPVAVRNVI